MNGGSSGYGRAGGRRSGAGHPSDRKLTKRVKETEQFHAVMSELITQEDVEQALSRLKELAYGVWVAPVDYDTLLEKAEILDAKKKDPEKMGQLKALAVELGYKVIPKATKVYQQKPDRAAAQYLVDQRHGAPKQRNEVTGADGSAITLSVYLPQKQRGPK